MFPTTSGYTRVNVQLQELHWNEEKIMQATKLKEMSDLMRLHLRTFAPRFELRRMSARCIDEGSTAGIDFTNIGMFTQKGNSFNIFIFRAWFCEWNFWLRLFIAVGAIGWILILLMPSYMVRVRFGNAIGLDRSREAPSIPKARASALVLQAQFWWCWAWA